MSLGYDIAQALPGLRAEAESRMSDRIKTTRGDEKVWDEDNGKWVTSEAGIYEGRARLKPLNDLSMDADAGSQIVTVSRLQVHVPVGTRPFASGDRIEVTASATRPDQVGRVFTVAGPFDGSQSTALRYRVEVADGR